MHWSACIQPNRHDNALNNKEYKLQTAPTACLMLQRVENNKNPEMTRPATQSPLANRLVDYLVLCDGVPGSTPSRRSKAGEFAVRVLRRRACRSRRGSVCRYLSSADMPALTASLTLPYEAAAASALFTSASSAAASTGSMNLHVLHAATCQHHCASHAVVPERPAKQDGLMPCRMQITPVHRSMRVVMRALCVTCTGDLLANSRERRGAAPEVQPLQAGYGEN